MLDFGKEYFYDQYYFFLKDKGNKFSLYYSVGNTIKENRDQDLEIEFLKEDLSKIKNFIKKLIKSGVKITKTQLKKMFNKFKENKNNVKSNGELDEFVGYDGSFLGSNIPMLNQRLVAKNTTDQTVKMARASQYPYIRIYYGESKESKTTLEEENYSPTYGYEEMENVNSFNECLKVFKELGIKDPYKRRERCMDFGYDPELDVELKQEKEHGECEDCDVKMRINELRKDKMKKMIDEILLNKNKKNTDGILSNQNNAETVISKLLMRNIDAIKKLAEKEGVSIDKLIKRLKIGE